MSYDNTNRGTFWKNDKKEKDTDPDFRGDMNIDGREFWISGWKRSPDANPKSPPLKFSIKPKDQQAGSPEPARAASGPADDSDSIPF